MRADQARKSSKSFFLAFQRCMPRRLLPGGNFESSLVPAVVCAALSIEIGFKAIVLKARREVSEHALAPLFIAMPADEQNSIVKRVGLDLAVFNARLSSVSNSFAGWRYIYETNYAEIDIHFITNLAHATQHALINSGRASGMLSA